MTKSQCSQEGSQSCRGLIVEVTSHHVTTFCFLLFFEASHWVPPTRRSLPATLEKGTPHRLTFSVQASPLTSKVAHMHRSGFTGISPRRLRKHNCLKVVSRLFPTPVSFHSPPRVSHDAGSVVRRRGGPVPFPGSRCSVIPLEVASWSKPARQSCVQVPAQGEWERKEVKGQKCPFSRK